MVGSLHITSWQQIFPVWSYDTFLQKDISISADDAHYLLSVNHHHWRNEMRCARHRLRHRNTLSRLSRLTMLMEYIDVYMEYLYVELVCRYLCTHNYIIYGEGTAFVRRHTEQPQTPPLPGARRAQFTCRAICCAVRMTVGP